MAGPDHEGWFERLGRRVSDWVADRSAHPYAQIGVIIFCALWWLVGLPTDILTAGLSIAAITLCQMVLNNQKDREADAHRRDVAMHAKLDELVVAARGARNELAGIEELDEDVIHDLKVEVKEAVGEAVHKEVARARPGARRAGRSR